MKTDKEWLYELEATSYAGLSDAESRRLIAMASQLHAQRESQDLVIAQMHQAHVALLEACRQALEFVSGHSARCERVLRDAIALYEAEQ